MNTIRNSWHTHHLLVIWNDGDIYAPCFNSFDLLLFRVHWDSWCDGFLWCVVPQKLLIILISKLLIFDTTKAKYHSISGCEIQQWACRQHMVLSHLTLESTKLAIYYSDAIMSTMEITSVSIVCSCIRSGSDQRKFRRSTSLAFVRGIHWWPLVSLHKGALARIMFPFDDVIM